MIWPFRSRDHKAELEAAELRGVVKGLRAAATAMCMIPLKPAFLEMHARPGNTPAQAIHSAVAEIAMELNAVTNNFDREPTP